MTRPAPIRWSTRSILIMTAAVAVTLAVFQQAGPLAGIGALFVLSLIAAHVVGTMVGVRMRDEGNSLSDSDARSTGPAQQSPQQLSQTVSVEVEDSVRPHTPLTPISTSAGPRRSLGPPGIAWAVFVAAVVSGVIGGSGLTSAYPDRLNPYNVTVAVSAAALLGGFATFGVLQLIGAVRRGLRHESEPETPSQPLPPSQSISRSTQTLRS